MQESEDILIEKCIKWDHTAQSRLYKIYSAKMFVVCNRYAKSREEAEDILQEGFVKVFENIGKFRKEGSLEGWIRRIMYHTAIQKFREKKETDNAIRIDHTNIHLVENSSEDILSNIQTKELLKLIQELPNRYQMVFNLYVFEGLKHREIAQQLGISEGTSKSNLSDARAILQKKIQHTLTGKKITL